MKLTKVLNIVEQYMQQHPKDHWFNITNNMLQQDPQFKDFLISLIKRAYAKIGGHIKIENDPNRLYAYNFKQAIDYDDDNEIDIFIFGKKYPTYIKTSGVGHDDTHQSKMKYLNYFAHLIRIGKIYSAASKALAHIMITRYKLPYVSDIQKIEEILKKEIDFIGEHPEGKYPDYNGWFYVDILGRKELKIMFGK